MATTKQNIGKIPIMKGEYQEGATYQRLNQVTMLGSTYQSKIDGNTSAPAQLASDGSVENINTDKWIVIAVGNVSTAKKVMYDNEESGLEAKNVQACIDEVTTKVSDLMSEIIRSEISIEETVENKYMLSDKQIQDDSRYKAYSMDYYPVEPNKFFRIIGTAKGIRVATIALLANKEATEALSVYDVSKSLDDIVNADRVLFIPEGVSYVAVSRNKTYTSKCYVVGEGESRLDVLEKDLKSFNSNLENKFSNS